MYNSQQKLQIATQYAIANRPEVGGFTFFGGMFAAGGGGA